MLSPRKVDLSRALSAQACGRFSAPPPGSSLPPSRIPRLLRVIATKRRYMIITSLAVAALTGKLVECLEGLRLESPFDPMAVLLDKRFP